MNKKINEVQKKITELKKGSKTGSKTEGNHENMKILQDLIEEVGSRKK